MAISQKAEVADAGKARGQHMLEEAAQELFVRKCHSARFAVMRVVLPSERHVAIRNVQQPVIGDGYAMGVASQIMQDMLGPAERRLGVDDPVFAKQGTKEAMNAFVSDNDSQEPKN